MAVDVSVVGECGDNNRFVFIDVCRVIVGDGVVIDRCNYNVDGGSVRSTLSITNGVGEGIRSAKVTVRCIGQRAIAVVVDGSADALREGINTERIAVDIAVVRQYGDGDQDRIIFVHRCRVITRGGVVVDRSNRDGSGACRRTPLAITNRIVEGVAAVEIAVGFVGERAVAIVRDGAVCALREGFKGGDAAVNVGVVGEHVDDDGIVFVDRCRVGICGWGIVDRLNRDVHGGYGSTAIAIVGGVGEGVAAVEVVVGFVGQRAIAIVGDSSVLALRKGVKGGRVTVNVGVVREYFDDDGVVFVDRYRVSVRRGIVIDRIHRDVEGAAECAIVT